MDMPLDQPSPIRRFWRTWRREVVRGGVLFGLVVGVGLAISRVRVGLPGPWEALQSFGNFDIGHDGDLFGGSREIGDPWEYRAALKASQQVWIRNTNGPVDVVAGTGEMLEVLAEKSWRHSEPDQVELVAVPGEAGVTICALWPARERACADGGVYKLGGVRKNDIAVRFTVKLPRGVRLNVATVNGELSIEGAGAAVEAKTVNGRIVVHTAVGPVRAATKNGSVEATLDAWSSGNVELETINGSVTAVLPPKLNAVLDAETFNGRVETEFPLQMTGKISPRQVRGTIGTGGLRLKLNTINGSITIRRANAGATRAQSTPAPPPSPKP